MIVKALRKGATSLKRKGSALRRGATGLKRKGSALRRGTIGLRRGATASEGRATVLMDLLALANFDDAQ